jgi:inositol phosphorylceramide synthase catalytic subunit
VARVSQEGRDNTRKGLHKNLAAIILIKRPVQRWQATVCAVICGYLALGVATHSVRAYHWLILGALPLVFIASERGRQFFLDWSPLFAFWMVYDRLRLLQPLLYHRVAVEWPYRLESWLFGWMSGGEAPAHACRAWLETHQATSLAFAVGWSAQLIYFSYLFILPAHLAFWWWRGKTRQSDRGNFVRHLSAFTLLHAMAMLLYLSLPVAPPWWVSLHGMVQPTVDLVANTSMADAMDGVIVQKMIKNAAQWFGAVPSLHAAYPMLLFVLSIRRRSRFTVVVLALYSIAMCVTTVILNQHYIIDLIAAAALSLAACKLAPRAARLMFPDDPGGKNDETSGPLPVVANSGALTSPVH